MVETRAQEEIAIETPGKRLLIAEDNPVTHDLLKLFLGQHGHQIDIAQDGEQAFRALQHNVYDIALLDYHLPKMNGLEVANAFKKANKQGNKPIFVAITADPDGLLANEDNDGIFDQIIPKPLDIHEVCTLVEKLSDHESKPSDNSPYAILTNGSPLEITVSGPASGSAHTTQSRCRRAAIETLGYEFLRLPDDINSVRLSARGMQAVREDSAFDAILVTAPAAAKDLAPLWQKRRLHLLPVIDQTGSLGSCADLGEADLGYGEGTKLERLVRQFHERRAELHHDLVITDDTGEKLLGRAYVAGGFLQAFHDPRLPGVIAHNTILDESTLVGETRRLIGEGFLQQEFFDRVHVCDRCHASRFNVREECVKCRSANLFEEPYLHHFKCAYQGAESDFRQADALVCPKCRQELRHFSVDYDKPGSLVRCLNCGHAGSDPAVGFKCLDCDAHFDGDAVVSQDAYTYTLTDKALSFLVTGRAFLGPAQQKLRFSDLPLGLIVALNGEARRYNEEKTPFSLLDISYQKEREIVREHGPRQFGASRDLILETLRNTLTKDGEVIRGHTSDYALLKGIGPGKTEKDIPQLRDTITMDIKLDLGVRIHVFGPEDFT